MIGRGTIDGWGVAQWGPVAAWVSSFLTVFAIAVALYQAVMARRDADIARAEAAQQVAQARADAEDERERAAEERSIAEARHAQQLAQADELLSRELDARRRSEQIATIPPIWAAIGKIIMPFNQYIDLLLHDIEDLYHSEDKEAAAGKVGSVINPLLELLADLELVFMPAQMTVSEPTVFEALNDLYEDTRRFQDQIYAAINEAMAKGRSPDLTELQETHVRIGRQRKVITRLVREHLAQVPPLERQFYWTEESD